MAHWPRQLIEELLHRDRSLGRPRLARCIIIVVIVIGHDGLLQFLATLLDQSVGTAVAATGVLAITKPAGPMARHFLFFETGLPVRIPLTHRAQSFRAVTPYVGEFPGSVAFPRIVAIGKWIAGWVLAIADMEVF